MTLDINAAIDNLTTLVAAQAAAIANPILDVQRGDPIPNGRCVRVWYAGEAGSSKVGTSTINSEITAERAIVTMFWPIADSDTAAAQARDREVFTLKDAVRRTIIGHSTLSGTVTDLTVSEGRPDWTNILGTPYRVFEYEVDLEFSEYLTAA